MNHLPFIAASYAASLVVLSAIAVWILAARARAKRDLAALEASGIKRRSES
jgi:heme exporter protein D